MAFRVLAANFLSFCADVNLASSPLLGAHHVCEIAYTDCQNGCTAQPSYRLGTLHRYGNHMLDSCDAHLYLEARPSVSCCLGTGT